MRSPLLLDVAIGLHYAFVAYLPIGGFLALRRPRLIWVHVAAAAWGVGILTLGQPCPLTALENWARGTDDGRGFVDRHLTGVVYPESAERLLQVAVGLSILASWVLVLRQRSSRRRMVTGAPARG